MGSLEPQSPAAMRGFFLDVILSEQSESKDLRFANGGNTASLIHYFRDQDRSPIER